MSFIDSEKLNVIKNDYPNIDIEQFATEKGYIQISDDSMIDEIVDQVLNDPVAEKAVTDLRNGNDKVIGFLVGQVMQKSAGKANPKKVQEVIKRKVQG